MTLEFRFFLQLSSPKTSIAFPFWYWIGVWLILFFNTNRFWKFPQHVAAFLFVITWPVRFCSLALPLVYRSKSLIRRWTSVMSKLDVVPKTTLSTFREEARYVDQTGICYDLLRSGKVQVTMSGCLAVVMTVTRSAWEAQMNQLLLLMHWCAAVIIFQITTS